MLVIEGCPQPWLKRWNRSHTFSLSSHRATGAPAPRQFPRLSLTRAPAFPAAGAFSIKIGTYISGMATKSKFITLSAAVLVPILLQVLTS